MIITYLRKARLQITISLLIALSSVFLCVYFCGYGIIEAGFYSARQDHSAHHSVVALQGHGDNHDVDPTAHKNKSHHDHQSREDDDFCKEQINLLYENLINNVILSIDVEKLPILILTTVLEEPLQITTILEGTKRYHLDCSLSPPSGAVLRILIQSFLN